jgi:hypothetical protein
MNMWIGFGGGLFGLDPLKPLENMVGATGFEPVTSTV